MIKNLLLLLIISTVFSFFLMAQPQVNLTVDDNWMNIKVKDLESHCNAVYKVDLSIQGNNINIFIRDTSFQKCKSTCNIDLEININQIPQGNYNIFIYNEELVQYGYNRDIRKLLFKKDAKITENFSRSPLSIDYNQTYCNNINENINNGLEIYPNPISS